MSTVDPFVPGGEVLQFRLVERVGASVWRAEDTHSGRSVALKILTRQLPKDQARRDTLLRDARLGAALFHTFLVPVLEIVPAGDTLLLVMEWVEGQSVPQKTGGKPLERAEILRITYQLADVLKLLHARNIVHGNVAGDSVLICPSGQVRLGGLNLMNLLPRKEGATSPAYGQKGSDAKAVSYMSPEQVSSQPADGRTDIFSLGVVMYELATGKLPYAGTAAADIARNIVEGNPQSPKALNPAVDNALLAILGKCLFKDPFRRHKDMRGVIEEIAKVDPEAAQFATDLATHAASPSAKKSDTRRSILLMADVATYDELMATNPDAAARAAARMQQILGESVFLFDGQIVDPFGARLIAELPSVDSALEAARKGEFDFSPGQQDGEPIPVRLLLHAGDVTTKDGVVVGEAVTRGVDVLRELPPGQLFISEAFVKQGRGNARLRDAGAKGGVKLFTIQPAEPQALPTPSTHEIAVQQQAEAAAVGAAAVVKRRTTSRRRSMAFAAGGLLLLVAGIGGTMLERNRRDQPTIAAAPKAEAPAPATAAHPRKVLIEEIAVEGGDAALAQRASAIHLATVEILRSFPEIRIADAPAPDVTSVGARLRAAAGGTGAELVPTSTIGAAAPAAVADVASGVQSVVQWATSRVQAPARTLTPDAVNAFADALTAKAANDSSKTENALRASIKADPKFLPAQMLAMNFFEARGKDKDALEAARQVTALDPENLEAMRHVARETLRAGDVGASLAAYGAILKKQPADAEALNTLGRYSIAVSDAQKFNATLMRLASVPGNDIAVHAPDLTLASGKIESVADQYYDIEVKQPTNPALALKIGRIAVLRRTLPIADLEIGKLQKSDPNYGYHLLRAYVAAEKNVKGEAESELKAALAGSRPGDDYWTSAAEIYAMVGDNGKVVDALTKAATRKEPTMSYVLINPLFNYLASDARFQKVRASLAAEQDEVRAALAQIPM
jgi:tetratricopeptide (TPR) repeat protein